MNYRHNVSWWKSRCMALEAENDVLRETVRKLTKLTQYQFEKAEQLSKIFQSSEHNVIPQQSPKNYQSKGENKNRREERLHNVEQELPEDEEHSDHDSLEFQVNEGMMDFLQQSIKHKMELKQQREEEEALEMEENLFPQVRITSLKERTENAKLLYGEASPRILGMETALQATIDGHKDKTRPNYWPNLPLKL